MSPLYPDFLDPTPMASMRVWALVSTSASGQGLQEVLSTSQTCYSLTSLKEPLLTIPLTSAPSCLAQE